MLPGGNRSEGEGSDWTLVPRGELLGPSWPGAFQAQLDIWGFSLSPPGHGEAALASKAAMGKNSTQFRAVRAQGLDMSPTCPLDTRSAILGGSVSEEGAQTCFLSPQPAPHALTVASLQCGWVSWPESCVCLLVPSAPL